ncbi:MAG: hypothetical protein HQ575_01850 [Candidatus Omnitrophica bacterium]|nr:hypothetical protein [Candidatus Omnitrophota bacterium]
MKGKWLILIVMAVFCLLALPAYGQVYLEDEGDDTAYSPSLDDVSTADMAPEYPIFEQEQEPQESPVLTEDEDYMGVWDDEEDDDSEDLGDTEDDTVLSPSLDEEY